MTRNLFPNFQTITFIIHRKERDRGRHESSRTKRRSRSRSKDRSRSSKTHAKEHVKEKPPVVKEEEKKVEDEIFDPANRDKVLFFFIF